MKKGFFVTFEGGDGCGKSTQITKLKEFLDKIKVDYVASREPGGTVFAKDIREILLHTEEKISAKVEFLLLCAIRADHVEKVIKPALEQGKLVMLDRYYDSSFIYQGFAGGQDINKLKDITDFVVEDTKPDLTFLFDVSFEECFQRKMQDEKLKNLDRMEQKGKEYHDKVREGYLKLAAEEKQRYVVIDATLSIEKIFEIIKTELLKRMIKN